MRLSELLIGIEGELVDYDESVEISSIAYDSRRVKKGALFAALSGVNTDGNKYIAQAVAAGASFVITSKACADVSVGQLVTTNPRKVLRKVSENFYSKPEEKLGLVGITGTNGKTTIAQIISHILKRLGRTCGVIGTVEYDLVSEVIPAPLTTPESPDFQRYLKSMVGNSAEFAICEFSSQALAQERVTGKNVDYAVFTNLSRDHLDNHGTMENYFLAKKRLFDKLSLSSYAIVNSGDEYSERIVQDTKAKVVKVGYKNDDDFCIVGAEFDVKESMLDIKVGDRVYKVVSDLIGEYNAINLLQAIAVVYSAGIALEDIIQSLSGFRGAGGRLQRIDAEDGRVAFVDYAHTDDALLNALKVLRNITKGRLIVVFGCGGDRDSGKRPLMAGVAENNADLVILTNDNPRTENPVQIMDDVLSGITDKDCLIVEYDRAKAIEIALAEATSDDVVLVAGKGHENYQIVGTTKNHFDDREVICKLFVNE